MWLEPALLFYVGLACLALSTRRVRRGLLLPALPKIRTAQALALIFLALAAWRSIHHYGPYQGPVAAIGMLCAAGIPLLLLLSRWPRLALLATIPALALAIAGTNPPSNLSFSHRPDEPVIPEMEQRAGDERRQKPLHIARDSE